MTVRTVAALPLAALLASAATATARAGVPNDACADALPIAEGPTPFSNVGATDDGPITCTFFGADVWYAYTAAADGLVTVSLCGSGFDTALAVFAGWDCPAGAADLLACSDDACGLQSEVTIALAAGQQCLLQVAGFAGQQGDGVITISSQGGPCPSPCSPGDALEPEPCGADVNGGCNAPSLAFTGAACGDTWCGSAWADGGARDTDWYLFETGPGLVTATLQSQFPGRVVILDVQGGLCRDVTELGAAGASSNCRPGSATAVVSAGVYAVLVATANADGSGIFHGYPCGGGFNDYRLAIECPGDRAPANDLCDDAIDVEPGSTPFTTSNAGTDGPSPCGSLAGDVWFRHTPETTGTLVVSTCGSAFDTVLAVYDGCVCPVGAALACNDDAQPGTACAGTVQSELTVAVEAGRCYAIQIGGFAGDFGEGVLSLSAGPCPGRGSCFQDNGTPGCADAGCCQLVCDIDPFCCDVQWDGQCAAAAAAQCSELCPADVDGSGEVGVEDLILLIVNWGCADPPGPCPGDVNGDGVVDVSDLVQLVTSWGPC